MLTPYHEARSGFLFKMPIGPDILQKLHYQASFSECVSFSANDRVKLSYHADGFAQFSGEVGGRIISGRDPVTKEPKGLGLITHPLAKPIWTGGSVGITMWGIEAFDDAKERDECICFEPDDFYYRDCTPSNASGWHVRIYAFPRSVVPPLRFRGNSAILQVAGGPLSGGLRDVVEMRHIDLPGPAYLGVSVHRVRTNVPTPSGWSLNGPGDWSSTKSGHVLMGFYPRDEVLEAAVDYAPQGEGIGDETELPG